MMSVSALTVDFLRETCVSRAEKLSSVSDNVLGTGAEKAFCGDASASTTMVSENEVAVSYLFAERK